MRQIDRFGQGAPRDPEVERREHNISVLLDAGLAFAVCVFLASLAPKALAAAVLGELLKIASLAAAGVAALGGESVTGGRLTHWDVAAALWALAIAAGWLAGAS